MARQYRRSEDIRKQVLSMLREKEHVTCRELCEQFKLNRSQVYRTVRNLRVSGVGVYNGFKGYVLSENASKRDDLHFFRLLNGRRTSDIISFQAARKDILKRWRSVTDKGIVRMIAGPLTPVDLSRMNKLRTTINTKLRPVSIS